MSPSKRAGGTAEPDAEQLDRGNGHGGANAGNGSRPKRRSAVANGTVAERGTVAEQGTVASRGASSSSITRRAVEGPAARRRGARLDGPPLVNGARVADDPGTGVAVTTTDPVTDAMPDLDEAPPPAPTEPLVVTEPAVDSPIVLPPAPPPPPTARVDPAQRHSPDGEPPDASPAIVPTPLPVVAPPTPSTQQREAPSLLVSGDVPVVLPEPQPYLTTTMSSHQIAPVPRLVGRRPRVRKVTRVVRHVDPWSVFKVALVFNLVVYAVLLTAGVLLWNVAYATGTIDNLERFFESFGWSEFEFDGGAIYHSAWIAGLFGVVGLTGTAVLGATLFNLITDLVGGVRMTVLEEEVVERTTSPMRRFVVRRPTSPTFDPGSDIRTQTEHLPTRREPVEDPFR